MKFDEYQKKAWTTAVSNAKNLPYVSLGLAGEAGEVANKVKKWIRDNDSDPAKLDKRTIAGELGDVLWYVAVMAELMDLKLDDIATGNTEKLASRQQRGKISGSGDIR